MQCISPMIIGKSGDKRIVPCGKCGFCLEVKRADWTFRLKQELKVADSAHFLTLTYNDEELPLGVDDTPTLCKKDVQLFIKRLRKENGKTIRHSFSGRILRGKSSSQKNIRYYTVGEYGTETNRPHYHSIMFNLREDVTKDLEKIWKQGHIKIGSVTDASIHYVTKYVVNRNGIYENRQKPFSLISNRSGGIGNNYLSTHTGWHIDAMRNYTAVNGIVSRLPRYYKDRIFDIKQREKLALEAYRLGEESYRKEIDRISRYYSDPYGELWYRYNQRIVDAESKVVSKTNQLNTL